MAPRSNPFHYGTPATGENFTGRESEIAAVLSWVRNGISVAVIAPRRYGKTSLLKEVRLRLERGRPAGAAIELNVLLCKDLATFASRLVAGVYSIRSARWHRARQAVPEFVKRLHLSPIVTFGDDGRPVFGFSSLLASTDADVLIGDVFDILATEAKRRPAVLVLDEFQAITRHGKHLPDLFKGLVDGHPDVCLVLAGSKRHLMEELVVADTAPLFGMTQKIDLGPIPEGVMVDYLRERSRAGGKLMADALARRIVEIAGPVPNDIQHLAFEVHESAAKRVDEATIAVGLRRAIEHEAEGFVDRLDRYSPGQVRVLMALAAGIEHPPFSGAFAREVGLATPNSVRKALAALRDDEVIIERGGELAIADPFFAVWLRQADRR